MRVFKIFLITAFFFICFKACFSINYTNTILPIEIQVKSYKIIQLYSETKERLLFTRKIETKANGIFYYYINIDNLGYGITDIKPENTVKDIPPDSLYYKIKYYQNENKIPFGNSGELENLKGYKNIVLTSDLCPTKNNYDRIFYDNLEKMRSEDHINIPLIIFFSGKWIVKHIEEMKEIKTSGLDFIAGNHTYNHNIIMDEVEKQNIKLETEIENTDRAMLENGILPSYFFRFPGLKKRPEDFETLSRLNMIAIDANQWMGKSSKNWGILLVHSNGVVSQEVRAFLKFLKTNENKFRSQKLVFRDIVSYFRNRFDNNN